MQTATSTLLAAIQGRESRPVARVKADWKRDGSYAFDPGVFRDIFSDTFEAAGDMGDLTGWVESLDIDRSLSTDLPEAAKVLEGFGSASATVVLSGTMACGTSVVQALNANASWVARVATPVTVDLGYVGTAGPEYLRQFTGQVRSLAVDPAAGTVTLSLLDKRDLLRNPVTLPMRVHTVAHTYVDDIMAANPAITYTRDSSLNPYVSTPPVTDTDPWVLLQQIAEAECAVVLFDEGGTMRFYNRDRMSGGAAVATVTTDPAQGTPNLISIQSEESIDSVRNRVTVGAVPLVEDPANTVLWEASEVLGINPFSYLQIPVSLPGSLVTITSVSYSACLTADGTGTNITNLVASWVSNTITSGVATLYNPNGNAVFLVYNTVTTTADHPVGDPAFVVTGRTLRPTESEVVVIRDDPASQAKYGAQALDVSANIWLQSQTPAGTLADHLVGALKEPHPTLSGVAIVGDPRLQLTDRVRVAEPDGLALSSDFWLVGIATRFSASDGLVQSTTLRGA